MALESLNVHHHIHFAGASGCDGEMKELLRAIFAKLEEIMSAANTSVATVLAAIQAAETAEDIDIQEAITLITQQTASITTLNTTIAALQAGQPVTADQITALQGIATDMANQTSQIAAVLPPSSAAPAVNAAIAAAPAVTAAVNAAP